MEWSVSQSNQYNACPKSWFVQHRSTEGIKPSIRSVPLKSVIGIAVHRAISGQIDNWRDGKDVSAFGAEEIGLEYLSRTFAQKNKTITEFANGVAVENETLSRMEDAVHLRIATFFKMFWPHLSKHQYVTHEKLDSFMLDDVRMWVQVDLATRDLNGEFLVSDWKTSQSRHVEADSHQMEVYALWANRKFEPDPARIRTQVINLRSGHVDRRSVSTEELEMIKTKLIEEAASISEALRDGNFPASPSLEKCVSCNILSTCTEGSSIVQGSRSRLVDLD